MDAMADAVSGLRAAQLRVDVAANNVANLNTPGFQPSTVAQSAQPGGGVSARVAPGPPPPAMVGATPQTQPSGTDLITEMATMVTAPITYAANGRVIDAATGMTRTLLDVLA